LKCRLLALLFIFPLSVKAFDKDFRIMSDRIPLEFVLLFDSMKLEAKTPKEKLQLVGLIQELEKNLGFLNKEHIFFLMKSEVIKNTLEHRFPKVRQFDMTNLLVDRIESDFEKKKKYLNSFSQWIWKSIIAELRHRQGIGLITDKSFSPDLYDGNKRQEALRFKRYLDYILPWIDRMDRLNASQFNDLSKEVSWEILRKLNERSILFKRFASTARGETQATLFNIPPKILNLAPEELKQMRNNEDPLTLKESSQKERNNALEETQKVTPDDMSPISDDVIRNIEQKIE
jgi:hypothetical protein